MKEKNKAHGTAGYNFYLAVSGIINGSKSKKFVSNIFDLGFYAQALTPDLMEEIEEKGRKAVKEKFKVVKYSGTFTAFEGVDTGDTIALGILPVAKWSENNKANA